MSRIKTFDSTGLATSGRLYAGDLNAIQDQYADLVNYAQTHGVGSLAIGEAGLSLLRYAAGEARLTGHFRTDGIVRALGGLYGGAFTTATRDAIPSGFAPTGLIILNTTMGRYEVNNGTDASRSWGKLGAVGAGEVGATSLDSTVPVIPIGATLDWPWASGGIPSWALLPYGQAISRTTYSALHSLASAAGYPHGSGDGSTTFNLPDYRGRIGVGKDDMGGVAAGRITAAISGQNGTVLGATVGVEGVTLTTGQIPAHNHGVTDPGHSHTVTDPGHNHTHTDPGHNHTHSDPGHGHTVNSHGHGISGAPNVGASQSAHAHAATQYGDFKALTLWNTGTPTGYASYAGAMDRGGEIYWYENTGGATPPISVSNDKGSLTADAAAPGTNSVTTGITNNSATTGVTNNSATTGIANAVNTTGITTQNAGSGAVHINAQPSLIVNKFMRVL